MKIKKILSSFAQWLLMAGASLTMGLLSFSGVLAICSSVAIACMGLVMSVVYEGQIYLDNIVGSFKKLFKSNQLERQLAKACLLEHGFSEQSEEGRPQFFKDYERQLHLLHRFDHKRLDEASEARKHHVEKTLGDMEKWFAKQLFSDKEPQTNYQKAMREWLERPRDGKLSLMEAFQAKRKYRHILYQILKAFCVLSSVFMAMGTTYLLVEAFAVIPLLATLPAAVLPILIVPMALIAGMAYGLLVYNAITDMIASEMVQTWFKKIGEDLAPVPPSYEPQLSEDETLDKSNIAKPVSSKRWWAGVAKISVLSVMFLVSLFLSICTAGTWWTVVKTTKPLFSWMGKIPGFIMLVLNPLILSVSTWAFNVENISETLEMAEPTIDSWVGDKHETNEPAEQPPIPDEKCDGFWKGNVSVGMADPDLAYQKKIVNSKEIMFVSQQKQVFMWYCDKNGECKKTSINNPKIVNLISNYPKVIDVMHLLSVDEKKLIKAYLKQETGELNKTRTENVSIRLTDPDNALQKNIIYNKDIVFVRHNDHIVMWYCEKDQCKRINVSNVEIIRLIEKYNKIGKITDQLNLNDIKAHLVSIGIQTETFLQWMNPFRLFSYLVFDPLRKLLFLGHLISIGATADQVPGVSPLVPAVVGAVSEGVEDIHYFKLWKDAPQEHNHDTKSLLDERLSAGGGHDHGNDLPTKFLIFLFSPIHFLAACWDFLFSQNENKFSSWSGFCAGFEKSWNKETGTLEKESVEFQGGSSSCEDSSSCVEEATPVSSDVACKKNSCATHVLPRDPLTPNAWQTEQALFRIEKEKRGLVGTEYAQDIAVLTSLQDTLLARQEKLLPPRTEKERLMAPFQNAHARKKSLKLASETSLGSTINHFYDENNLNACNRNSFFKEQLIQRTFDPSELCVPCSPCGSPVKGA